MKRRFLPLSLFLIFTMLGGLILSSSNIMQDKKYVNRSNQNDALSYGNKQSAEYLKLLRNNQVTGIINPKDLIEVQKQLSEMKSKRAGFDLKWDELGPDNFGGRTRALVFDNKDSEGKTAIAGSVGGGLWKTTNGGTTWSKINTDSDNLNVSCMIQTNSGDFYVGTGESFSSQSHSAIGQMGYSSGFMGKGLYKSTDGENFNLISSTKPTLNDQDADFAYINEVAYNESGSTIYTSTNNGLKYSTDGGSSWKTAKDSDGNELSENSTDVHASSNGLIIASVNNMAYVSFDGNPDNFQLRSIDDSAGMLPLTNVKRIEFAIAPSDENIVYASVVNQFEDIYNIYRSENQGDTWEVIMPGSSALDVLGGQGVYNNLITVYPENPNKIIVGGSNLWIGERTELGGYFAWKTISQNQVTMLDDYIHVNIHSLVFSTSGSNKFLIGTDGGIFLGSLSGGEFVYTSGNRDYISTQFYSVGISGVSKYVIGGAQGNGSILITGNGNTVKQGKEIMGVSGLGFQEGDDGGPAVISLIDRNVLVASTTFGDVRRSDDAGENYSTNDQFLNGIGNINSFLTPMTIWERFDNENSRDSVMFYNRSGSTIAQGTNTMANSSNSNQPFYFNMPYDLSNGDSIKVVDPVSSRFFLATANHIYMIPDLHNFAKTPDWWEIANSDYTVFGGIPQCISVSNDGNYAFVGTQSGKLYRISNLALAYNFERADVSSPSCIVSVENIPIYETGTTTEISQIITSIAVDQTNPNNILVTLGNYGNDQYLMYSTNALAQSPSFESKQGNLPKMPVYSGLIEMKDNKIAIIGTENGLFTTTNITAANPSWEMDYSGMGSVPVFDLKQQVIGKEKISVEVGDETVVYEGVHNKGLIYAATFGRGLLYTSKFWQPTVGIDEIADNDTKYLNLDVYPNPATDIINIDIKANSNSEATLSIYSLNGKMVVTTQKQLYTGDNKLVLDISHIKSGTYLLKTVVEGKVYSNKLSIN